MARVYELNLPGNLKPGSRAAKYVSRYAEGRSAMWATAMEEAKQRLQIAEDDFQSRRQLAEATREAILEQIAEQEQVLADLRSGSIDSERARARRNIDRTNKANEFTARATNAATLASTPSTTTSTTTPTTGAATPEPESVYPTPREFELAFDGLAGDASLEVAYRALDGVRFASGAGQSELQQQTEAALAALDRNVGQASGARSNPAQVDLARALVREGVNQRFVDARGDVTLDDARAIQIATDGRTSTEFDTIFSLSGRNTSGTGARSGSSGSVRTSTTSRSVAAPVTYDPLLEGPVDASQIEADLEERLRGLRDNLEAVELPEQEVASLVDTARDEYRRLFGLDRLRTPEARSARRSGLEAGDFERLLRGVESLGVEEVRRRASGAPAPATTPPAPATTPPAATTREQLIEKLRQEQTPTQRDTSARLNARVRGAELARSGGGAPGRLGDVVTSLYQSRGETPLARLEDEVIRTYDGDEQRQGLELLHSLAVLETESTLADGGAV